MAWTWVLCSAGPIFCHLLCHIQDHVVSWVGIVLQMYNIKVSLTMRDTETTVYSCQLLEAGL